MKNYKKIISLSISENVYFYLKEKGNMSSYINDLVLKDLYSNRKNVFEKSNEYMEELKYYLEQTQSNMLKSSKIEISTEEIISRLERSKK